MNKIVIKDSFFGSVISKTLRSQNVLTLRSECIFVKLKISCDRIKLGSYMSDLVTPCLTGRVKDNRTKGDLVKEDYSRWLEPSNAQAVELPAWDMGGRQFKAAAL